MHYEETYPLHGCVVLWLCCFLAACLPTTAVALFNPREAENLAKRRGIRLQSVPMTRAGRQSRQSTHSPALIELWPIWICWRIAVFVVPIALLK